MSYIAGWIKPFLSGVIITAATMHIMVRIPKKKKTSNNNSKNKNTSSSSTTSSSSPSSTTTTNIIMDSPKLDQRIIRKAEGALQNRTSRLIVVVERCTNDHNYSAILRTVEALGVQHVYIIDPQACNSTLKKKEEKEEVKEEKKGSKRDDDDVDDHGDDGDDEGLIGDDNDDGHDGDGDDNGGDKNKKNTTTTTTSSSSSTINMKLYRSTGQQVRQCTQEEVQNRAQHHLFAKKALEWLDVKEFEKTSDCITELRSMGYKIWSTDLSQVAVCLTRDGLKGGGGGGGGGGPDTDGTDTDTDNVIPEKLAIVFGTEAVGCTSEMLHSSDKRVYLPLRGFADSLNLSVATALVVHQLFTLDPTLIGSMSDNERMNIRRKWYTKLASQRLLSKSGKTKRKRLLSKINALSKLERRQLTMTEPNKQHGQGPLRKDELERLKDLDSLKEQLQQMDDDIQQKSLLAVEELVNNPPEPLGDMRRADEHRTTFAGKNTKKHNGEAWADMPATGYYKTDHSISASFFRNRLKEKEKEEQCE